jgi:hypothetical protein
MRWRYVSFQSDRQQLITDVALQEFLNDYGMIWVGRSGADGHVTGSHSTGTMWSPNSSLVAGQEAVDFDTIIKNVKELNILAGEGSTEVAKTPKGAQLKVSPANRVVESVVHNLYTNAVEPH